MRGTPITEVTVPSPRTSPLVQARAGITLVLDSLPPALPSTPPQSCPQPTWLAGQSLGFSAETLQVVVAPLLVLLQGALLLVAPATVVTLVGLTHRGRGDCAGERGQIASMLLFPVPWLHTAIPPIRPRSRGARKRKGCRSTEFFCCLPLPDCCCEHGPMSKPQRRGTLGSYGKREGPRSRGTGLLLGLKRAKWP